MIWLRSFLDPTIGGDQEFRRKHENVLEPIRAYIGVDDSILEQKDIQESYKLHLERLRLIRSIYKFDNKTKLPKFNNHGVPEISYRLITPLGKLMLKRIGLLDSTNL